VGHTFSLKPKIDVQMTWSERLRRAQNREEAAMIDTHRLMIHHLSVRSSSGRQQTRTYINQIRVAGDVADRPIYPT